MCQRVFLKNSNWTYNAVPVDGRGPAHRRVGQLIVDFDLRSCENVEKEIGNTTYVETVAFGSIDSWAMELTGVRIGAGEIGEGE
jgi:hypothetical protein